MKKVISFVIALAFIGGSFTQTAVAQKKVSGNISLSGAFALYPLAVKWAEEFKKINPDVKIDISAGGAGKGVTDALGGLVDIGMVSREVAPEEVSKGGLPIAVAKDAVVATVSASNPEIATVLAKGLTVDAVGNIWITGKYKTWKDAFGTNTKAPIHVYTRSDACGAADIWAKVSGKKQEDLLGSGVFGDPGLALAVKKDPLGIGYNNIGYAYDAKTKKQNPGIKIIPLDINKNGKIDAEENFYDTVDDLMAAIADGRYPSPPSRKLYFLTKGKPQSEALKAFIQWVLTDGQKYVKESGYINLKPDVLQTELNKIK